MKMKKVTKIVVFVLLLGFLGFTTYDTMYPKVFADELKRNESEYVLYYHYEDCSACQSIADVVNDYFYTYEENGNVKMYKIDIFESKFTDAELDKIKVENTPTMYYIKNGRIMKKAVGTESVTDLVNRLKD